MEHFTLIFLATFLFGHIQEQETAVAKHLKSFEINEQPSGMEGIDCIYVINLDVRPQKWKRMQEIGRKHGLNFNRFSAVNGWGFSRELLKELMVPPQLRLNGGQVGCIVSHLSVLKHANSKDFSIIWVMEDDIEVLEDIGIFPHLIKQLTEIDPDWDVLYTDTDTKNKNGYVKFQKQTFRQNAIYEPVSYYSRRIPLTDDLMEIGQRYGSYSMIISRKGIKKILNYFTHVLLWSPYDNDLHYIPGIRQYSTRRDIVSVYVDLPSDTRRAPGAK